MIAAIASIGKPAPVSDPLGAEAEAALAKVAAETGVRGTVIRSYRKDRRAVLARWAFWTALRELGWGVVEIGRATGHDHSTVAYGLKRHRPTPGE